MKPISPILALALSVACSGESMNPVAPSPSQEISGPQSVSRAPRGPILQTVLAGEEDAGLLGPFLTPTWQGSITHTQVGTTHTWTIEVTDAGPNGGHIVVAAFSDPEAGEGPTTAQNNSGAIHITSGPVSYAPHGSGTTVVTYVLSLTCGRGQADIAIDDGSDGSRVTVVGVVFNTGVDCVTPPPGPPAPPVPPVPPPVPPTPPVPPQPPVCTDNCEPEPPGPETEGLCHIWAGNDGFNEVTLFLPPSAVRAHLRQHQYDYLGACEGHSPNPDHPQDD